MFQDLTASEKITKAKVSMMMNDLPFFAYLAAHLKPMEIKMNCKDICTCGGCIQTMGVNLRGDLPYNPDWINELDEQELIGVLAHEVLHLVCAHISRGIERKRNLELYNIASDLCVNDMLLTNRFQLPKDVLIPKNHSYTIGPVTVKDIDKKTADQVYDELYKDLPKIKLLIAGMGGFDKHIYDGTGKDKSGEDGSKEINPQEAKELGDKWKHLAAEAAHIARQRGNLPAGIERLIGSILEPKLNWKQLLYKFITQELTADVDWNRPSRRSQSSGYHMPAWKKEKMELVIAIDTSGSISKDNLEEFMSEIFSIFKSFTNIEARVITCDCQVYDDFLVKSCQDIVSEISLKGGGGTSHVPVWHHIEDHHPNTKLIVALTDGYTEFPKEEKFKTIWVVNNNSIPDSAFPFGTVVRLE